VRRLVPNGGIGSYRRRVVIHTKSSCEKLVTTTGVGAHARNTSRDI